MEQIILFAFLVIFPFGQIIRIGIFHPLDIIVGIGAAYAIIKRLPKPAVFKYFSNFLLIAAFTWVLGATFYGFLYLIRLAAYFYFFVLVWNFKNRKLLLNSLLSLSLVSAIFGWVQYFWFPSFKPFMIWGWDEHLYRIAGTFFDPAFLALILVFGIILSKKWLITLFLMLTLAFTYSRAAYLAFLAAMFFQKRFILIFVFLLLIFFLPRPAGEGVMLERTASITNRLDGYKQTLNIFEQTPLFGVGYNNLCLAKNSDFSNHACSGSDSSLLFILATTGVVGFISFIYLIIMLFQHTAYSILHITLIAVLIHSFFSNSIFYPWVLGWLIVLLGSEIKRK